MRSVVVVGFLGFMLSLSLGASAFGGAQDQDVARGKKVLENINILASGGLSQAHIYKYKIAGLCKFVGQLIHMSSKAESLSTKLQNQNQALAESLLKARAIIFVAEVDICTDVKTFGEPDDYDKKTEDKDANTLEQNFVDLVKVSSLK